MSPRTARVALPMLPHIFQWINCWIISDRCGKSFPNTSSHGALSSGYFCDASATDETDDDSDSSSPRGPPWSGIPPFHDVLAPEPHYQFRKSDSMKLALKEADDEGLVSSICMPSDTSGSSRHSVPLTICVLCFNVFFCILAKALTSLLWGF